MSTRIPNQLLGAPRPSTSGLEMACTVEKVCPDAPVQGLLLLMDTRRPHTSPTLAHTGPLQGRVHASMCVTHVMRHVVGIAQAAFPTFTHHSLHVLTWR